MLEKVKKGWQWYMPDKKVQHSYAWHSFQHRPDKKHKNLQALLDNMDIFITWLDDCHVFKYGPHRGAR